MIVKLIITYIVSLVVIFAMFRIDKRMSGAYISGTEIFWMVVLFVPVINTIFAMLMVLMYLYSLVSPRKSLQDVGPEIPKVIYDGIVDGMDDEAAYVRLYDARDKKKSHAEILLDKFPSVPETGYLFEIRSNGKINYHDA